MSSFQKIRLLLILLYAVFFLGLWTYDETPIPSRVTLMTEETPALLSANNLWLAMLGCYAPEGTRQVEVGKQQLEATQKAIEKKDLDAFRKAALIRRPTFEYERELPITLFEKETLISYVTAHADQAKAFLQKNEKLLQGYKALRAFDRYEEPLKISYFSPTPDFSLLRSGQKSFFMELAMIAAAGNMTDALAGLKEDTGFWRFVLRNAETLFPRMTAIGCLRMDFKFAAELADHPPISPTGQQYLDDILMPLEGNELLSPKVVRGQIGRILAGLALESNFWPKPLLVDGFFFKPEATLNREFLKQQKYIDLAELSSRDFAQAVTDDINISKINPPLDASFLYNPVGEILTRLSPGNYFPVYIQHGLNLEGVRRMAKLKIMATTEKISPKEMSQFLKTHATDLGNPYTEEAMSWDQDKGKIFFQAPLNTKFKSQYF
ncbi:hypothetical protein [Pelobacter seleniigenes]|uniref:hypothetical protein n=1 Tax=Pelobacter seleniigenes TaxID=407188 RepID=UPI0004A75682|nr:hypothetical protein [Pelobacter seleniigenes]